MSLLTIVQHHCQIHALNTPASVIGNGDTTIKQILGLLNELVENIVDESKFQAFTKEATHTLTVGSDQGAMSTLCPSGYLWAHNGTFFNRTLQQPLLGPVTAEEWQLLQAQPAAGPGFRYRIWKDHLYLHPAPTASTLHSIAWEYASSYGVLAADGVTGKSSFTVDTDTFILPEKVIKRGLSYRWKQVKGLAYQADETAYYAMLNNYIARDGTARVYNLAGGGTDLRPGITVPMFR